MSGKKASLLTLDQDASEHDGDQLAALEDDLRGVVEVAQGGVGQPHGAHSQERDEHVGSSRDSANDRLTRAGPGSVWAPT